MCANANTHIFIQRCKYGCVGQANQRHAMPCQVNTKDKTKHKSNAWMLCLCLCVCVCLANCQLLDVRAKRRPNEFGRLASEQKISDNRKQSEIAIAGQRETVYILPVFRLTLLHDYLSVCVCLFGCYFVGLFDVQLSITKRSTIKQVQLKSINFAMNMNTIHLLIILNKLFS